MGLGLEESEGKEHENVGCEVIEEMDLDADVERRKRRS